MRVVIAEKPSVAFDIAKALGKPEKSKGYLISGGYYITWALGHLFEIDEGIAPRKWRLEDLPIFPGDFKYTLVKGREAQFQVIRKLLERAEVVINCGDAGREGELIVREILNQAGFKGKTLRLWTSEALTREVVTREFSRLRPSSDFDDLYYSALARQHGDWIVGINLTRLVTLKAGNGGVWSVGRVQTPTLAIVVRRDLEVESFKPEPYFVVLAKFKRGAEEYEGIMLQEGKEARLSQEEAESIALELETLRVGRVGSVFKERRVERPPLLHSLTSLQREANSLFGFSAKATLDAAQRLYEEWKVISYPRTDARYMGEGNKGLVKQVLRKLGREDLIPRVDRVGKRVFDSSKLTDHHAIIPLDPPPPDLPERERKVYFLIHRKFVGAFMDEYEYELIKVITRLGSRDFLSQGRLDIKLGWMELYDRKESPLPDLREGEEVENGGVKSERRQTKPPPRYTEATLLKEMEKLSLGTPSTRASIIETLLDRGYLKRKSKVLISTVKGRELVGKLGESRVASPEMTSQWERVLEEIYIKRRGVQGYREFIEGIKRFVREEVERLSMTSFQAVGTAEEWVEKGEPGARRGSAEQGEEYKGLNLRLRCKCGGEVVGFPKGWRCRSCGAVVWKTVAGKRLTLKQVASLFEGREIRVKGLKSKKGRKFQAVLYMDQGKVKFKF